MGKANEFQGVEKVIQTLIMKSGLTEYSRARWFIWYFSKNILDTGDIEKSCNFDFDICVKFQCLRSVWPNIEYNKWYNKLHALRHQCIWDQAYFDSQELHKVDKNHIYDTIKKRKGWYNFTLFKTWDYFFK